MQESALVFRVFPSLAQWPPDSKHLGFVNMQIPGLQGQVLNLWGRAEEICQDSTSSRRAGAIDFPLLLYPHCLARCLTWCWHSTCLLEMSKHLQCFLCIGYCSMAFLCMNSFNPYNSPLGWALLLPSWDRWGSWGTERGHDLPRVSVSRWWSWGLNESFLNKINDQQWS